MNIFNLLNTMTAFLHSHRLNPQTKLFWLKINGKNENDDFLISSDFCLTVSENALNLLKQFNISHAEITALA